MKKENILYLLQERKEYYSRRQDYHQLGLPFFHLVMVEYHKEQYILKLIDELLKAIAKQDNTPETIKKTIEELEDLGEDR